MITTLLLIFGFGVSNGQETTIEIPYSIYDINETYRIQIEEFLEELETELLVHGINIIFVEVDANLDYDIIYLDFGWVTSYSRNSEIAMVSLLLSNHAMVNTIESKEIEWTSAHIAYALGEYDVARQILNEYENPSEKCDIQISRILGNIALIEARYQDAIQYFECAINDENYQIPRNLAWSYVQSGDLDSALELLNPLFDEFTIHSRILAFRSQLYAIAFDYDSAIADIDEAIRIAEANDFSVTELAELYTIHGEIIFLIYEWDRVEEDFNTAIELDPSYSPAYFQRGVLFYTMARREDAQADFEQYLELEPDGIYAEQAQTYIESIETELEALGE
ncbi:MAG: tetratricopeptide repeat protein [Chloroflexota bacterium]